MVLYTYIRGLYIKKHDGENINFDNNNRNLPDKLYTLLSYVKLLEVNPLHYNTLENNPYKTLPGGLIIWNAAYPI
jgi:hypothetical protein